MCNVLCPDIHVDHYMLSCHSNTNPQSGQYLTYAHSHINRAVAAMDSCFGPVRRHRWLCHTDLETNQAVTAVHGCHCRGDMAVRMRTVLARPWVGGRVCHLL